MTGRTVVVTGGEQRDRPRRRPRARGQARTRRDRRAQSREGPRGRRCDDRRRRGPAARPRRPRLDPRVRRGLRRACRRADQQRGRHDPAAVPHGRRLRAAVRNQPPGTLRTDEPAPAADPGTGRHRLVQRSQGRARSTSTTSTGSASRTARWPAYAQSKLANLLFTSELQRRLTEAGSPVIATAAHPGLAATNLLRPDGRRPRAPPRPEGGRSTCSRRATTTAHCPRCTRPWRTFRATAMPARAASWRGAARRSWSAAPRRRRTARWHVACGSVSKN